MVDTIIEEQVAVLRALADGDSKVDYYVFSHDRTGREWSPSRVCQILREIIQRLQPEEVSNA